MPDRCFTATSPAQKPLGVTANGQPVYHAFRPTVTQFAHLLTPFLGEVAGQHDVIPFPPGMKLVRSENKSQLQLVAGDSFVRKMRKVFGYIGEIMLFPLPANSILSPVTTVRMARERQPQLCSKSCASFRFALVTHLAKMCFLASRRAVYKPLSAALTLTQLFVHSLLGALSSGFASRRMGGPMSAQLVSWSKCASDKLYHSYNLPFL